MKNKLVWLVGGALLVAGIVWLIMAPTKPGKLDDFASCLAEKGAIFYGAFWCSHCQNQKALFGNSARLLPYVECSTPDGKNQLPICKDQGVTGYPTWDFITGTTTIRESGEISLARLSELTNCPLPVEN
ncbi:MAG: hypothetical protein A3C70_01485 [Candidatus Zambryskibacteria bacterium RIFCSPHIGHO2_02_FULL_43_14]|uniref:Thioredoxin domain-containing protein n=1 Tax=Candidatus Zambryskibacteria bacterium RIFCSPHIGHO2_02_FULL_43_14 TaxID=1802748 RepID=A0A1G2THP2_9BACT|nr:MAG: hypothetical protein A2829_03380 [Candidatus Zambryskibacteria bacterium RIFCSPHIGHO2_01_FULL_43_60]OHA96179.1 MAG: hypothetical protein A3C70_01485 [Candidatus Zambryskibacteria bacterium RIFCSPHIGHO2_02_FULL_43_14]OHB03830.1 MAG: hypothetical protein A3B03_03485 [Candidatus Zambryskibacteria bacterium RIFCSPLOWO2_01_FULL_42_41]